MATNEVVLVTGANTGLGFQIVRALYGSDKAYSIYIGGRSLAKVNEAIKSLQQEFGSSSSQLLSVQVDIEDDDSIQKAFEAVHAKFGRLDTLINNAGGQFDQQLAAGRMTMRQMWNQTWNVNTTGTQIMTSTFVPLLLESSNPRLIFIASGTSSFYGTQNFSLPVNQYPPQGWPKKALGLPSYRSSKAGMNMMMREWYRVLKEDGVKVWCVSPGMLATNLGGDPEALKKLGAIDPAIPGQFIRTVVEGKRDADVGQVILKDGVQQW